MLKIMSNEQLDAAEKKAKEGMEPMDGSEAKVHPEIVRYIWNCWEKAKKEKEAAELQILANMRQINGIYDPEKLQQIKNVESSEVFVNITDVKCRHAYAWMHDLLFQPTAKPWGLEPTPIPEVPADAIEPLFQGLVEKVIDMSFAQALQKNEPVDAGKVQAHLDTLFDIIKEEAAISTRRIAKEKAVEMERKIDDQLTEGNFYEEFRKCLNDVIMYTGIMKGPFLRKEKIKSIERNSKGRISMKWVDKIIPKYERRHPIFIYPAAGAIGFNDGYIIDRISMTPKQIQDLLGQPGFNDEEINKVLAAVQQGGLQNWLDMKVLDQDLAAIGDTGYMNVWDSEKVDCIEFWGSINGKALREWGLTKKKVPNELLWYDCTVWMIGPYVIKASIRKDPKGEKPFSKCSFEDSNEHFWGRGLPQVIKPPQDVCNATARAIVNNMAIACGPQVERNVDRIAPGDINNKKIRPFKVWDVTEAQMTTAPALKFYAPPMVVERLLQVFNTFSKLADEYSGIPAFAHGDPRVGGAGNTASGLSMLISSAARGIKLLIAQVDNNLIAPVIKRQYEWNIEQKENYGMICDFSIVAKGATAMLAKEQMSTRRMEAIQLTNNPIDLQLLGMEGRKAILREILSDLGIDVDKYMPEPDHLALIQMAAAPPPMAAGPAQPGMATMGPATPPNPAMRTVDAAGNPSQGTDTAKPMGGMV